MTSPYTLQPLDALMAAQTSVGMSLTAALWFRPLRPRLASLLLLFALWAAVLVPMGHEVLGGLGVALGPSFLQEALRASAVSAVGAAVLSRKGVFAVVAVLGAATLWWLTGYVRSSDLELAAAYLAFYGLLIGLAWRDVSDGRDGRDVVAPVARRAHPPFFLGDARLKDDVALFALATSLAALVSVFVLGRFTNSGDEVANTFQAAAFAKLRAYSAAPPCAEAFRTFWVFQVEGRRFSQYTPGWPLFMAPFLAMGMVWLAGPVSLGLLAVGVARLARRAALGHDRDTASQNHLTVRACGLAAALATILGSTMLINGGSRYPHVFVAAMYAWALEALCAIGAEGRASRRWGLVLGSASALLLAARPGDGAMLGMGLFFYFAYGLTRRRFGLRAVSTALMAFLFLGGLTLVILRLQLGKWFTTGYALTETIYPWAAAAYSLPRPDELKWGLPLATGSYSWWPCSPAVGLAGLATLRGRARGIAVVFLLSYVPFFTFYSLVVVGRGVDFGYGPRYSFPVVVPMAVGTGLILGMMLSMTWSHVPSLSTLHARGPSVLALVAVVLGVARIAPLVYPYNYADVHAHNRFRTALERATRNANLHNAVVFVGNGLVNTDPMDLTENLPLDLYRDQDVLVALQRSDELTRCVRDLYPSRHFFRAVPGDEIHIIPF